MKNSILITLFMLSVVLYGCETSMYTLTNEEKSYPGTTADGIKLTTQDKIDGNFTEIGYIFASGTSVPESVLHLKKKAAEFGGTQVIKLETMVIRSYIYILFIPIPIDHYYCSGIVIKS